MTTPRIEEYGEWDIEVDGVKYAGKRSLTKAHQAGIDEAVEKIKEEFEKRAHLNENPVETSEGTIDGSFYNIYKGHWEQALDDTIKTLQDNK